MFDTLNSKLNLLGILGDGFVGTVYFNRDPLNLDRIKVNIPDLFDSSLGDTPWCGPSKFSPFGCGANYGTHGAPAIGSKVLILFHDDDPHYPTYISLPTADQDFGSGMCWGFKDNYGNKFKVDENTITFNSHDGVDITITGGNVTLHASGSIAAAAGSDMSLSAVGSMHLAANSITMTAPNITQSASSEISQITPIVNTSSNLVVGGNTSVSGSLSQGGVNVGGDHRHSGVESGSSNSGPVAP